MTTIPPIKSQGIKTKLVPWIKGVLPCYEGRWIEPFMGTGVVAFSVRPRAALLCDANPHLIAFYSALNRSVTPLTVRRHLEREGAALRTDPDHYYRVRERFNDAHDPLDFLFLNRACFNGMIRFNRKGGFNTPFCRKPDRFSKAYVTKIVNQVAAVAEIVRSGDYEFALRDFENSIQSATGRDMVYCDPPYIDRHADYYNGWSAVDERALFDALSRTPAWFLLSTWHHTAWRENVHVRDLWSDYKVLTAEHFYHLGGRVENRQSVVEALILNYDPPARSVKPLQPLFQ